MKITKFKRALSVLLVAVMVISTLPFNAIGTDGIQKAPSSGAETNDIWDDISDWFFDHIIKPTLKPKVTVKGLPENAEGGIEIVTNPFTSKASSSLGKFLDYYDIKAKDKTTGEIVHPTGEVEVTIKDARIKQDQPVFMIHVLDDENVIKNAEDVIFITEAAFVSAFSEAAAAAEKATGKSGVVAVQTMSARLGNMTISGRDITFKTDSFSIFIIVDENGDPNPDILRRTYEFVSGVHAEDGTFVQVENDGGDKYAPYAFYNKAGKKVTNQILKNGEYLEEITKPDTTTRQTFAGWYTVESFDAETGKVVWGENSTEVKFGEDNPINDITQNETVYVAAKYKKAYFVTFHEYVYGHKNERTDEYDFENIITRVRVNVESGSSTQLDLSRFKAVPIEEGKLFAGWATVTRNDKLLDYTYSQPGDEKYITVDDSGNTVELSYSVTDSDVDFYPVFSNAHWLRFVSGETGSGASYVPAKYVISTTDLTQFAKPTKIGYTFIGWCFDSESGTLVTDDTGRTLESQLTILRNKLQNEDVTLYAKWTGNPVEYKVVIWHENADDDKYSFVSSTTHNANAGDIIRVAIPNADEGFHVYGSDTDHYPKETNNSLYAPEEVTIKGDGTTIVNIYYNRNIYQILFYREGAGVIYYDSENGEYGLVNGKYVKLTRGENQTINKFTKRYKYELTASNSGNNTYYGIVNNQYVLLNKSGNSYSYDTGTYTYNDVTNTARSDGQYYIPDGNGGYTLTNLYYNNGRWYRNRTWSGGYIFGEWQYSNPYTGRVFERIAVTEPYNGNRYLRSNSTESYSGTLYTKDEGGFIAFTGNPNTSTQYYYYDSNGAYVELDFSQVTSYGWTYVDENGATQVYNGEHYDKRNARNGEYGILEDLTITAKQGADISNLWPGIRPDTVGTYGVLWRMSTPNSSHYVNGAQTMPIGGDKNYYVNGGSYRLNDRYWFQSVNGGNVFDSYMDHPFTYSSWLRTSAEDYKPIKGFHINADSQSDADAIRNDLNGDKNAVYDTRYTRSVQIGSSYSNADTVRINGNDYRTMNYYYIRNQYDIVFWSNGMQLTQLNQNDIYYQADISNYEPQNYIIGVTVGEDSQHRPAVFKGWYDNQECLGDPYVFDGKTMPAGNITLYAKWEANRYRVIIRPEYGEINKENQSLYFKVDYDETIGQYDTTRDYIEDPEGEYYYFKYDYEANEAYGITEFDNNNRKSYYITISEYEALDEDAKKCVDITRRYKEEKGVYSFLGWYQEVDGVISDEPFDFSTKVRQNITLVAKWRKVGTYNIVYIPVQDTEDGAVAGTMDQVHDDGYADKATTTILNDPVDITDGYIFKGWQIVGDTSGKLYRKGDDFIVDSQFADSNKLIRLQAIYEKVENSDEPVPVTFIKFDTNYPDDAGLTHATFEEPGLQINRAYNLFTDLIKGRADSWISSANEKGYTLIGWSTDPNADPANPDQTGVFVIHDPDVMIGMDNFDRDPDPNTTANTLYAVWAPVYSVTVTKQIVIPSVTADINNISSSDFSADKFSVTPTFSTDVDGNNTAFELTDGQSKTFNDVFVDTLFSVVEASDERFDTAYEVWYLDGENKVFVEPDENGKYTVDRHLNVTIKNTLKIRILTVRKVADIPSIAGGEKDFTFSLKIGEKDATDITVRSNSSKTIAVPYGETVTVEEKNVEFENGKKVFEVFDISDEEKIQSGEINEDTTFTFNNVRKTATITIEKKIENAKAAETYKNREFTFESNQWNENKKITSQTPETITVPVGTTVTVTEQADDLFTTTNSTGGTYTAEITPYGNTTVMFTNTRKPVTVKVIKELDNKGVDNASWTGFGFPMNYTVDGTAKPAIPVAPGATGGTFTVPFGSTVTLTEAGTKDNVNIAEQFDVEYYEGDTKVPSVEFTADDDTPVIKVKNIRKTFTVTVTKTVTIEVEGVKFDPARDAFTFTPTLTNATYTATVAAFNLSNGGSKKYTEVPYGAKFSVKETENTLYDTSATVTVGEDIGGSYTNDTVLTITDDTTIAYTNVRKVAEVTIEKDFESKVSADSPRTFKFDYTYTDGSVSTEPATTTVTVTLTNGAGTGTSAAIKAPVGATFSATEHEYGELTVVGDKTKSVTVAENGNTIVFTNKREVVDVTIDKTVVSDVTADLNGSYFFNVYYEYIVDGVNKIYNENVEVSVMNGHGEVVVDSVPKNATEFKITELTDRGLIKTTKDYITTTGNGVTGATGSFNGTDRSYAISSITDNVTAKFVNTRDTVQVTVTKKVENAAAAALEENFGFTVSGTGYQFTINGNKTSSATFNLQHNGSQTITVPKGVDFVIEETANENYTTEITGATSTNGLTATVKTDATTGSYKVTYTNTRKPIKVNVTKELDNLGMSDSWNTFAFPISYSIDGGEWTAIAGGVKVGDTTKTVEVPYGSKIEIKELVDKKNGELAIEDYFNNDGPKSIDRVTTEGQTLTIKNTRQTVPVKVTKEVVSRIDADNSRDYKFTITTNSADQTYASQTVTIKGAGSATKDVPKGANVTVTETNADTTVFNVEYKNGETYQSGSSKTVDDVTASTEFVIRNTRKEYDLTISKTVNNFDASGDNVYPVTYKITYGDQNVASATLNFKATDDEQGIRNPTTIKVPYGCKVVVSENTAAKVTINGAQYSISDAFDTKINNVETDSHTISSMTDDQTVSVVNTRKTVTVTVHKVVDNKWNIIADKTAEFKIKINGATELETIQVAENNGKISWSKEYTVNYGESFTAVETPDSAFNTKVGYAENSLESGNEKTIEAVTKNSEHDIWFENTRKEIVVTVHKIVKNAAEQNDKFDFTAELKFGEQELTLADTDSAFKLMNYVENGTGDFNEKKITIPYGASIKVAENNYAPRYSSTSHITVEGESKTEYAQNYKELTKNALIEVTNDRQWTYIPVSKVLEAKGATKDANIEFEFTWKYETAEGTVEGSEALKLKGGETKDNVVRVPIGSNVTITETDISLEAYYTGKKVSDIFTTTNNHGSDKVATLTDVQATNDNTVTFTNTHKTVEVFLQKTVVYDYDKNTDFTFIYSGINNGIAANSETTRKHSEGSLLLVEIPVGTGIEVKETSVTGFSTTAVVNNTTYVLGDGNAVKLDAIYEETRINYTNTRELVDVVITKEVVNKGITADNNIEFKFDATAQFDAAHPIVLDDTDKTFNLAHGGSHTIKVPYGATVTVTEDTSMTLEGYNNVPVSTVFDTVKAVNVFENVTENVSATVTNTHREVSVKVTKAVEGLELDKNIEFEFKAEAVRGSDKVTLDNFKLKGADGSRDKSLTIPYGTTLTVTEKTVNTLDVYGGAKVSDVFTTVNGTYTFQPAVDSTQTVTVTNTHKTVQVTVTKIVEGVAGIDDKILYPMTITSVKGSEKATIEGVDTNDGFKLNGIAEGTDKQNSKTFDVYYGTDVKVKELTDTTLTEYGKKISDVFTTTNPEKTLANVKMDQTVEVKNTHNKVKVTVNKVVESEDPADMEKEFNFSATAKIGTTETLGNDDASFSLANGGSKQIDVYYGAAFKVDENLGNEASKYIVTVNGDKQFTAYENAVITFTNKRAAGDLTITKTVTSRTTTDAFVFEITKVTAEGEEPFAPLYVTIHPTKDTDGNGYGSVTIKQLEAGTYTVRELDNWSWAYTAVGGTEKSAKIIGGDQKQVDFTNKDKETNWLRDETANENHFENPKPVTENTTKSVEAVAWDSKFRLAYAAPAGRFDDKETA